MLFLIEMYKVGSDHSRALIFSIAAASLRQLALEEKVCHILVAKSCRAVFYVARVHWRALDEIPCFV